MAAILPTLLLCNLTKAQCDGRYENEIFVNTEKTTVTYSDVYDWSPSEMGLDMDIYQAVGDTFSNRPLLIFAHGGAYVGGDKNNLAMTTLCKSFAKRGYVTASIRYRLTSLTSFALPNAEEILIQTMINSMSDMKAAIRFFRKDFAENGNSYKINPNLIFVGGYSAGAITALHVSSLDDDEIPQDLVSYFENVGGIDGNSGNEGYSSSVSGAIILAGAIKDLSFLDENDVPVVSIHGTSDMIVNYNCGSVYQNNQFPVMCGAGEVHPVLDAISIYNDVFTINNGNHDAPILNMNQTYIPFISDFLSELVCNQTNDVELFIEQTLNVSPNPTDGVITLDLPEGVESVRLYNQLGQLVLSFVTTHSKNSLDISHLPKGMYQLVVFSQKHDRFIQVKVFKQ